MRELRSDLQLLHEPKERLHVDIPPRATVQVAVDHTVDLIKRRLVV
jgi:hypothetical protein